MKAKLLLATALIGVINIGNAQTFPVTTISKNGSDTNRVNMIYLADGYQSAQLPKFITDVTKINDYVFGKDSSSPLMEYRNFFNVYAIEVPSVDSGVTHAGTGSDEPNPITFPIMSRNTYFESSFDNGVHRAVVAKSNKVSQVLNNNFPMYDVPMVLVNTPEYGGTGGWYLTFSTNTSANETAVHEIGHTFGKLWDEYWNGMPGEHPNMTQQNSPSLIVWQNWLGANNGFGVVGIYPYGSSGQQATWYRPHQNCKMQYLYRYLCPVCKENIIDRIYDKVFPIDAYNPVDTLNSLDANAISLNFSFKPVRPDPNTQQYIWLLNGNIIKTGDTAIQLTKSQLQKGANLLTAQIIDTTLMSRSYQPDKGYQFSVGWSINYQWAASVTNVNPGSRFVYQLFPVPAKNILNLYCENGTKSTYLNYSIATVTGAVVRKGVLPITTGTQTTQLDIAGLAAGNYMCTLQNNDVYVTSQFVVE